MAIGMQSFSCSILSGVAPDGIVMRAPDFPRCLDTPVFAGR
jgi:hypothetical protein